MLDGFYAEQALEQIRIASYEQMRPSVLFRPRLRCHRGIWYAVYDAEPALFGHGDSPEEAMRDFDKAWVRKAGAADGEEKP